MSQIDRRTLIAGALGLAACDGRAEPPVRGAAPALKAAAPFPVGAAIDPELLGDPDYAGLVRRHFSQLTPENALKMGALLDAGGGYDFAPADALVAFAGGNGLRVFGHTLVWYSEEPEAFLRLRDDPAAFRRAYRDYILTVAGRYRGRLVGWDVVNEPVTDEADGIRGGVFQQVLGQGWAEEAFHVAREADPSALLFLNEYGLERPEKRRVFLRFAEDLLKRGAPLGGLGTQSHLSVRTDPSRIRAAMADLAGLGLPIHVAELDVRLSRPLAGGAGEAAALEAQARVVGALAEAFAGLPPRQRFAFTTWGVRDRDSWLTRPGWREAGEHVEKPLLLDDAGGAKPAFWAAVEAWR